MAIITDSTCDVPEALMERHGIIVVPQVVIWGTEQYRDRVDIQPAEFYRRLITDPVPPHSSPPPQDAFQQAYQGAIRNGAQAILVLIISAHMFPESDMPQGRALTTAGMAARMATPRQLCHRSNARRGSFPVVQFGGSMPDDADGQNDKRAVHRVPGDERRLQQMVAGQDLHAIHDCRSASELTQRFRLRQGGLS